MAWSAGLPLGLTVAAGVLYAVALRRFARLDRERLWRAASFYGGLAVILLALEPPLDDYADTLFSMHMVQHVLLLTVAPPLLVFGRPWLRVWRPFPLRFRRRAARAAVRAGRSRPLGFLWRPVVSWTLLNATLIAWHIPAAYDAAVRNEAVHALEHLSFLGTAIVFWGQVLGAPPLRARLTNIQRAAFVWLAMIPGWILAIVLAFASRPLYPAYGDLASRPWHLDAMGDQAIAAGVMWVPGSIAYLITIVVLVYRWLEHDNAAAEPAAGTR